MARGKNKNKKGGQGSAYKGEIDPILATALARPNSISNGGLIAKYAHEEYSKNLEINPGIESDWEVQEVESEDASQTLGEQDSECTPSVRQNVSEEEFEGSEFEEDLDTAYGSDGDKDSLDSQSICHNSNNKTEITPNEHAGSVKVNERVSTSQEKKKKFL